MATYEKRGDLQWRARVRRRGYPSQTKTFETKADAAAWARLVESEMDRGVWRNRVEAESTTLAECLTRYGHEITPNKKGWRQERYRIEQLKREPLATSFMSNIRGKDVAAYRDMRLSTVAHNTVRNELNLISHVFEIARKEWGMEGLPNPCHDISRPAPGRPRDRRLQPGEEKRLLDACKANRSPYIYPAVIIALETAMRAGEIAGLRWKDIHSNIVTLEDTKNGELRDVPLSTRALAVLKDLPRRIDGKVLVYSTENGSKSLTHSFRSVRHQAGIKDLHFHDLRHEATSRLFEKGLNPMQVAAITGHKTLQMLKRYTHLRAEDLAKMLG